MTDGLEFCPFTLRPLELKALRRTFGKNLSSDVAIELAPLPFYNNEVFFCRLVDHSWRVPNVRYAFYWNSRFRAHNWKNTAIYEINSRIRLCLDHSNLLPYIRFFFRYVISSKYGPFFLMLDDDDVRGVIWRNRATKKQKAHFARCIKPVEIMGEGPDGRMRLRISVLFKNGLLRSNLYVAMRGGRNFIPGQMKLADEEVVLEDLDVATETELMALPLERGRLN